ncbi:MAG: hypothetical protein FP826_08520 [Sphingomonadales bacterium]|nr:hypothetical protein [Sphingomonadales bacterium]MBU3992891.1 OB-fold domain-containing protein [Alphaproteobacteria bacterium]
MAANDIVAIGDLHPNRDYQAFLDQGRFMLMRDRTTGEPFFYPRIMAPVTGSRDLEWFEPSGRGTVYAVTIVHRRPPTPNHNVVLVDLAEGPRLMSRVEGLTPEDVKIGMAVQARVAQVDGKGVLLFDPAPAEERAA